MIKKLGFRQDEIKLIFVNGKIVDFDTLLKDGDRVGLAPPQLGMQGFRIRGIHQATKTVSKSHRKIWFV